MEQIWVFTFGYGQKHEGHYVKIKGSYNEARAKMFSVFGEEWAFQYPEEEWNEYMNSPRYCGETEIKM